MTSEGVLSMRVGLQQRVLPLYRVEFFEALATVCKGGLGVFAGQPRTMEAVETADQLQIARLTLTHNLHIFREGMYFCRQPALLDWLSNWDPDVLIVEANPRYLSTRAAVRWMHQRKRLVVGWGLGAPVRQGLFGRLQLEAWRRFIHQFDVLVTYSPQGAAQYRATGFSPDRIFVAPNATTHRPDFPLPERPDEYRNRPSVLFVGRLQLRKRIDNLLRACAALPDELQPEVNIVGDGPARKELELLAKSIYPMAVFAGTRLGKDLGPFYWKADLFVLPGTGGLAIQQAMAYGLPVIAAEADGTQQQMVRPSNGWQVPPGNLSALVVSLKEALSDVKRLRQMGAYSYRIVSDEINIEMMVKVFIRALSVDL